MSKSAVDAIENAQKGLDSIIEKTKLINKNLLEMKSIFDSFSNDIKQ
jgi:hypothetical protein